MPESSRTEWIPRLRRWAEGDENIRLALLVGSQARTQKPADAHSDIDLVVFTRKPTRLLDEHGWVATFGDYWTIHQEENALDLGKELRVLFKDGQDIDFAVFPFVGRGSLLVYRLLKRFVKHPEAVLVKSPGATAVLQRGFHILVNKDGIRMPTFGQFGSPRLPTPDEFRNVANDYWFHLIWTAKKLRRGELLAAMEANNCYLRDLLVRTIRWHAIARSSSTVDVWHGARFFEEWADPRAVGSFAGTVARYDAASIAEAIRAGRDLFDWLSQELGECLAIPPPVQDAPELSQYLERLLSYPTLA